MEGDFTGKDVYGKHFAPKDYLKMYYSFSKEDGTHENDALTFYLQKFHKTFTVGEYPIDSFLALVGWLSFVNLSFMTERMLPN